MNFPHEVLFEGFNKNLIVFKNLDMTNQKFKYDEKTKRFQNKSTGNAVDIHAGKKPGS